MQQRIPAVGDGGSVDAGQATTSAVGGHDRATGWLAGVSRWVGARTVDQDDDIGGGGGDGGAWSTTMHYTLGLALAYVLALTARQPSNYVYGLVFNAQMTRHNYFRMWVYASTTYLSYSRPPAGEGVVKAALALTGAFLGGALGLALVWTTNRQTGLQSIASPAYIFMFVAVLVFLALISPKLLNMKDKLATTFATTLLSVVSWSFVRGTRQAAAAAALTLIVGITVGILLAFVIGSCLFPISSTWLYIKGCYRVVDLLVDQLHHSLKLIRESLRDDVGDSHHHHDDDGSPGRSAAASTNSSVEEGQSADSVELKALRSSDRQLWQLVQRSSKLQSLLDDSQNEAYVRLLWGGYTVVPCWPFRCNSISKPYFTLVQNASRDMAAIIGRLSNLIRLGLSPQVLAELKSKQYPVHTIPRIADLTVAAAAELRDKVPRSMRPGSARLPSNDKILLLQREVLNLLKSEAEARDQQFSELTKEARRADGEGVRAVLDSIDQHMMWFSFLDTVKLAAGCLLRLHLYLSAAIIQLPWFEDSSLRGEELQKSKESIIKCVDALAESYTEGADEFGILEKVAAEGPTEQAFIKAKEPSSAAPASRSGGFGGLNKQ